MAFSFAKTPKAASPQRPIQDGYSFPVSHRVRIFSFARAALQQGLADVAYPLMEIAAAIPVGQTGRVEPGRLSERLQQQIGDALLTQAERDAGEPDAGVPLMPWTELLKTYDGFGARFPGSSRIAYAQDAANVLRRRIAEEAVHNARPLEQLSQREQVAENIYQLGNLHLLFPGWSIGGPYPLPYDRRDGRDIPTPVHRLIDLGDAAVPQLIEALDDHTFTRTMVPSFNGTNPRVVMRVSDFAREILSFMSGRNFSFMVERDGTRIPGTVRQRAEAWWAEVQTKGDRQQLIDAAAAGGVRGVDAARKLLGRYPDASTLMSLTREAPHAPPPPQASHRGRRMACVTPESH